ncbi:polysaccharide pyruvyl transferase family protein [Subtercola sp. RTI3]|uniref:polysaccharide pyruvyl transferase family protein n=1 Tax=Subtercola sp. RTI3 TaxID=3048639 RepID=UPI002B234A96|nr:polysaccharide pyruvyl transferase family protein [Subtercola sp. RTI3]MEA9987212.1 polysaccharide pyruvyl transferase family protein [Subtercola sp. RTI3]
MAILGGLLQRGDCVALVDFPNHKNSGDHLIFLGTLAYLKRMGIRVEYIADATRYNKSDLDGRLSERGPILLQGGGNFGDRWPETQKFRERVIAENHDRRVIQLPQGIEFITEQALSEAQSVYSAHPNLTILIRDHVGVRETTESFASTEVLFCPDLALGVGRLAGGVSDVDVVELMRRDSESVRAYAKMSGYITRRGADWGLNARDELAWKVLHLPGALVRRVGFLRRPLYPLQRRTYLAIANLNVRSAQRILSHGEIVITDRLHGAVLAALMGKPVVAMNNANGKVAAIFKDYLGTLPNVWFETGHSEAGACAEKLIGVDRIAGRRPESPEPSRPSYF